jgi:hypothetical protein
MSYEKQTWQNLPSTATPISAERLTYIEDGIYSNSENIEDIYEILETQPEEEVFQISGGTLGTQPTFTGDPLFTGSYVRSGQLVHFQVQVDFDNITSFGTGQYVIDLPFPSKHAYQFTAGCLHDVSTGKDYPIFAHVFEGQSQLQLQTMDVSGQTTFQVDFTSTVPVTLDVADNFHISGTYIVAGD